MAGTGFERTDYLQVGVDLNVNVLMMARTGFERADYDQMGFDLGV